MRNFACQNYSNLQIHEQKWRIDDFDVTIVIPVIEKPYLEGFIKICKFTSVHCPCQSYLAYNDATFQNYRERIFCSVPSKSYRVNNKQKQH